MIFKPAVLLAAFAVLAAALPADVKRDSSNLVKNSVGLDVDEINGVIGEIDKDFGKKTIPTWDDPQPPAKREEESVDDLAKREEDAGLSTHSGSYDGVTNMSGQVGDLAKRDVGDLAKRQEKLDGIDDLAKREYESDGIDDLA